MSLQTLIQKGNKQSSKLMDMEPLLLFCLARIKAGVHLTRISVAWDTFSLYIFVDVIFTQTKGWKRYDTDLFS